MSEYQKNLVGFLEQLTATERSPVKLSRLSSRLQTACDIMENLPDLYHQDVLNAVISPTGGKTDEAD